MAKAMILYFDANNEARLVSKKVQDGTIELDSKQFLVDFSEPLLLKKGLFGGYAPLYICKWSNTEPASNINRARKLIRLKSGEEKLVLDKITPEWKERFDITPELLRKIMGMKILGNMIKTKKDFPQIMLVVLGALAGIMIFYGLIASGVVKL
jgi:hypothetical protein